MDLYLIIDGSQAFQSCKAGAIAWVNERVVDRLLEEGDRVSVWAAGERAELVFSGTISASGEKDALKDQLAAITATARVADFYGALRNVHSGISGDRLSYTLLVTASAGGLEHAIAGDTQGLFRWFRSERYEQWQVLAVAPDIGRKVSQAAAAYMNSQQRQ
jgi:predicted site-specific integrase-resolvase